MLYLFRESEDSFSLLIRRDATLNSTDSEDATLNSTDSESLIDVVFV